MDELRAELRAFVAGRFPGREDGLVLGEGPLGAAVMLIGEAPGEQEEKLRRPFVGKAGRNLDGFLAAAGLDRSGLYVTNAVKLRPTRLSRAGRVVNRPPTREEIDAFEPWLRREIRLVRPGCVVTLGNVPLQALLGRGAAIGRLHGQFLEAEGAALFPMYHPASVIYNPSLKAVMEADMRSLAGWLRAESR